MEGLIGQIGSILSGDMISLAMKLGLVIVIPVVIGIVSWILHRKAEAERKEKERREAEEKEKQDSGHLIDDNQKDSSQAKTDLEKSEEERRRLLDELNKPTHT